MAVWIRVRGGRLTYAGRLARAPFAAWTARAEGSAVVASTAREMRFHLFGRERAARQHLWRALAAAAAEPPVASIVQEEADAYLARLGELAFGEGLPRVAVNLYRLIAVPRQVLNGVAVVTLTNRLRREPSMTALVIEPVIRFFAFELVRQMDAAVAGLHPSPKHPLAAGSGWITVGLNTTFVWFAAVEQSVWSGHHFVFEVPREPIRRATRKAIVQAMEGVDGWLPSLSTLQRTEIVRRAWPANLLG